MGKGAEGPKASSLSSSRETTRGVDVADIAMGMLLDGFRALLTRLIFIAWTLCRM